MSAAGGGRPTADVNPDLAKERRTATFDVERVTRVLYGSNLEKKRAMEKLVQSCAEIVDAPEYHFMSREERYTESIRRVALSIRLAKKYKLEQDEESQNYLEMLLGQPLPLRLHTLLFVTTLRNQGTDEQRAKWLSKAENFEILGAFAQTELGHGSNVRALETTATYDPNTEQFVMNSPTITAAKFWPGGLGKTCNYAVIMARLCTNGQFCGIHTFLVQLRDLTTHYPLPGITLGDIGPKFGYDPIDNGFLCFDNVRIPRDNMLMRHAKVLKDGTFVKVAQHDKLSYGSVVRGRAVIIQRTSARALALASTIAVRYSCVRRQSELQPGQQEAQIIDFQTQQYKLFPQVASAYAYWMAGKQVLEAYTRLERELEVGNTKSLPEFHALVAGLKAVTTANMMRGIEQCRLACGGHGFSQASGLPKIYVNFSPACTYDGENTVMLLQTARFLVKSYQQAQSGAKLTGSVAYLMEKLAQRSCIDQCLSVASLVNAYKYRASRLVSHACERLVKLQAEGRELHDASNACSVYLLKAAEAYSDLWIVENFASCLSPASCGGCSAVASVLTDVFKLYAAFGISTNSGDFSQDGYMSAEQIRIIDDGVLSLLEKLRPNIVALVDAFEYTDHQLGSILGRFDGQVYENLFNWAANSPLNKTEVHESHRFLREALSQSKL